MTAARHTTEAKMAGAGATVATAPAALPGGDSGLLAFKAHVLFPGRTSVRVGDVAQALGITQPQVVDLIEEYRDTNGASGLAAVNVASGLHGRANPRGNKTRRCHWRIPLAAFDAFIEARKNNQPVPIGRAHATDDRPPIAKRNAARSTPKPKQEPATLEEYDP